MKNTKIVRKSKKAVKSSKKLASKKVGRLKSFNGKSSVFISLCLNEFIEGLDLNLIVEGKGKNRLSFATLSLFGEPIACSDMEWDQRVIPEDGGLEIFAEVIRGNELAK